MALIVLGHVDKVYAGGVKAISGLDLDIRDGEFMVLVGPSGCGKSTALRIIAGLEEISGGTIEIGGQVVNSLPPKDRDIAMVFQNYALYPHMTVEQNLAFALRMRKMPRAEISRRVSHAAKMLGLTELLSRKPGALSGGQRQRVAMGRAIVREPQAFLMDEPLSNLDAKLRVSMRASLNQLHERLGITTVYVTHDQVEAMTLGDRVCVMRDGRIQQVDTPQRLFESPVNLFVAGFIGSPAMNFAAADLTRDAELGAEPAILGATDCPFFTGPGGEHFTVATSLIGSRTFPSYLRAMRRTDLADDPRFATAAARRAHFAELHHIVQTWILTFHDIGALDAQLDEAKIALGEVRSLRQLSETEWAEYWGADQKVSDRNGGVYRLPGRPWRFSREKLDPLGEPAFQGEHNRAVLSELGLSDEQIDGYVVSGALVSASIPEPANQRNPL